MNQTIIDLPTFTALKDAVGDDFIDELLLAYYEETPQLLMTLQQALNQQDCDAFQRAAHSLKSTSNSFGALKFGLQAKDLEMMGKAGILEGAQAKVDSLKVEYDEVQQILEALSHGE